MGRETKMKYLLVVAVVVLLSGCENQPTPSPCIRVERVETSQWAGITVYFDNHNRGSNGRFNYVTLNSPEEIVEYREQVEFLLARLEEAELRMNVHEPEPEIIE